MSKFLLVLYIFICSSTYAQNCKTCPKPIIIQFFDIEWKGIPKPKSDDSVAQYEKLAMFTAEIDEQLDTRLVNCMAVMRAGSPSHPRTAEFSEVGAPSYSIYGIISRSGNEYLLNLFVQTACSRKKIAEAEVPFQLYPNVDVAAISSMAAIRIAKSLDIPGFEVKQRESANQAIATRGNIVITPLEYALKPGQTTPVAFSVLDCDGKPLPKKEITFEDTQGGTFSPAKVTTDEHGVAIATFKMGSSKGARLRAKSIIKNVTGCESTFLGSQVLEPGLVMVDIEYLEVSKGKTDWKKTNPYQAIEATGLVERDVTKVSYNSIFYHKPSAQALKNHFLVYDEKTEVENYGSVSYYLIEGGEATYEKVKDSGTIGAYVGALGSKDTEDGEKIQQTAQIGDRAAVVMLRLGDGQHPPEFTLELNYTYRNGIPGSSIITVTTEDNPKHTFIAKKVKDPKSPFKSEYEIVAFFDLAEEFKEGLSSMGFDLKDAATVEGYRFIKVRILSPFPPAF